MYNVTLIPGDGIGPEIAAVTKKIIDATKAEINWEEVNAGIDVYEKTGELVPNNVFESIEKNKIALKGPITTPVGKGFRSINVQLRKKYDLYSNVREVKSFEGIKSRYENIDMVIFRENTEGLYIGKENKVDEETMEAIKVITKKGSTRIVKAAFEYAKKNNKKVVTVAHKANILKFADGLFLNCAREVAKDYPEIELREVIIDNMCMQMVINPNQFEVIVTMNLYGDILSDLAAGLIGGLGMAPGANIGEDIAIFEAVHGSAPDIAGKNLANPTALLLSGISMLRYLGENEKADIILTALKETFKEGKVLTKDLGGNATTTEFGDYLVEKISALL
ncbi:MAG: isocitrate dehydrogenase [Fusobacteriaceae bacterium]|jgi:isocitrate dehydrogenase (NAD+)|nr:isocitrate dehydrogenase [Fusobacteriaceae bacterium]